MKHSEYTQLTNHLDKVIANADTIRLVFSKVEVQADPATLEPGEPATRWVPTDQAREHPGFQFRYQMLNDLENTLKETEQLMDGFVDGWTDENQARADQGLGPTADVRKLYASMSRFLVVAENPIQGAKGLFLFVRNRCRQWINQANEWFPDLNNQDGDQDQAETSTPDQVSKRAVTVHPDRAMLSRYFNDEFKAINPGQQQSRFDRFFYAMSTAGFTKTEWGRVAHAIKWNHKIVADRVRNMDFAPWLKEFFQAIGLEPPKDTRQNKYKEPANKRSRTRDFARVWLG